MTAISEGIGSGAVRDITIGEAIKEAWCDFMTIDVRLSPSVEFKSLFEWRCQSGINSQTMTMLNEEFNHFRGLFPLKVFITGPPCSGKTLFGAKLNELYGVPHISINDIVEMGKALTNDFGKQLQARIEELKDQAEADYEKTRKKKDPDFDRASCNPRLPDDVLHQLVKIQLNSAGCQNKGFIMEGYPRTYDDCKQVFMDKHVKARAEPPAEGEEEPEPEYEFTINQKVVPQYTIALEADDASLIARAKELPAEKLEGSHWNDAGMARRLKDYRAKNPEDSKETIKEYFIEHIGHENVLVVDSTLPQEEQLVKMKEIIEQKGKPCCINMIADSDKAYLAGLERAAQKEQRAKARAEALEKAEAEGHPEGEGDAEN